MSRRLLGLALSAALVMPVHTMAAERTQADTPRLWQTPSFDPNSVPSQLRGLEGKIAFVTIPGPEAPVLAARGAAMRGNVQAMVVTKENTITIPFPLSRIEAELDNVISGEGSDQDGVATMKELADQPFYGGPVNFVLVEDGTKVRIVAPDINNGGWTQVLPLTGHLAGANGDGNVVHLWINDCFLRFADRSEQAALWQHQASCNR